MCAWNQVLYHWIAAVAHWKSAALWAKSSWGWWIESCWVLGFSLIPSQWWYCVLKQVPQRVLTWLIFLNIDSYLCSVCTTTNLITYTIPCIQDNSSIFICQHAGFQLDFCIYGIIIDDIIYSTTVFFMFFTFWFVSIIIQRFLKVASITFVRFDLTGLLFFRVHSFISC